MSKAIVGHDSGLVKQFEEAGLVPENCRRIVIDISYDSLVTIYHETFADNKILDVDFAAGISIKK